eukprot:8758608-Alexandrium_andersonii.AAC.1
MDRPHALPLRIVATQVSRHTRYACARLTRSVVLPHTRCVSPCSHASVEGTRRRPPACHLGAWQPGI